MYKLPDNISSHVVSLIDPADVAGLFLGDEWACRMVNLALGDEDRAKLLRWAFGPGGFQQPALQTLLAFAWKCGAHRSVLSVAGGPDEAAEWFRRAEFPVDHLPERFTVWRGAGRDAMGRGLSWTRDRDRACTYAMYHAEFGEEVAVMRREVGRDQVLGHFQGIDDEVVLAPDPHGSKVDGHFAEWQRSSRERNERDTIRDLFEVAEIDGEGFLC